MPKSLEPFWRKAVAHGRTDGTDSIGPSGFQPGTNKQAMAKWSPVKVKETRENQVYKIVFISIFR